MTSPSNLRPATAEDLPALCTLEQTCFTGYYQAHRFTKREFATYLRLDQGILIVAQQEGRLVGYVAGVVSRARASLVARLNSLAVMPDARRQGIGGAVMQRFLDEARQRGCERVTLEVAVPNETGIRFFTGWGFTPTRRLPAYYSQTVDGLRMQREV